MHISCIHHFVIGKIFADLIGTTFLIFVCKAEQRTDKLILPDSPYDRMYPSMKWLISSRSPVTQRVERLLGRLTSSVNWPEHLLQPDFSPVSLSSLWVYLISFQWIYITSRVGAQSVLLGNLSHWSLTKSMEFGFHQNVGYMWNIRIWALFLLPVSNLRIANKPNVAVQKRFKTLFSYKFLLYLRDIVIGD
jgi:hypothetical protein